MQACNPYTGCGGDLSTYIDVVGSNDNPIAVNDVAYATQGSSVTFAVLGNDTDPNGDTLSVSAATANKGSVTVNSNNTLTYTSMSTGNDTATINYTLTDGKGGSVSIDEFIGQAGRLEAGEAAD